MLQAFVSNVSEVCCNCFIRLLQKWIGMLRMLQWLYMYVASSCSQCFICFFRRMLQVYLSRCCICFHIYDANVLSRCCVCLQWFQVIFRCLCRCFRCMFQMFHLFSDVCCNYCICMFKTRSSVVSPPHLSAVSPRCQAWEGEGVPTGAGWPHVLTGGVASETWADSRGT
jgi:hypothetical protein